MRGRRGLVREQQGGCTPETRAFLHRLCGTVAVVAGLDPGAVKTCSSEQVAVLLVHAGGRAIRRRLVVVGDPSGLPLDVGTHELKLDPLVCFVFSGTCADWMQLLDSLRGCFFSGGDVFPHSCFLFHVQRMARTALLAEPQSCGL